MPVSSVKIYKGYPFWMIAKITDSEVLSLATLLQIRFKKPDSELIVERTATIVPNTTDEIRYKVTDTENDTEGQWTYWPYVENSLGEGMPGTINTVEIYPEGT